MARTRVVFSIGAMHGGGSERQLVSLLRHIDRSRFEPLLYLIYRSGPLLQEIPDDVSVTSFEERDRSGMIYVPGLMHRRRVKDLCRYLKEVRAEISYDRTFLMTLIAADAARLAGVPNVSTIVTDPTLGFAPVAGRFQFVKRRILGKLYSNSPRVLANSQGAARSAESFYGLQENSVVVHHNGVDLESVRLASTKTPTDTWWTTAGRDPSTLRIVTAGRLNREKGFHLLIDAVKSLTNRSPDRHVALAILGEGTGRRDLQRQIDAHGLQDQVRLVGFQKNAPAWYKDADVFVLPSFLEGMPNVLLEAMAVGTPVISTDCPSGPAEILDNGRFGRLTPVGSVEGMVAELLDVSSRDTSSLCTAAKAHVESEFSITSATRKLQDIFEQLTAESSS